MANKRTTRKVSQAIGRQQLIKRVLFDTFTTVVTYLASLRLFVRNKRGINTMSITITVENEKTTYYIYKKYGVISNHDSVTENAQ